MKKTISIGLCVLFIFVMAVSACALNYDGDGYSIDLPAKSFNYNGQPFTESDDDVRANISTDADGLHFMYATSITECIYASSYENNTGYTNADFNDSNIDSILSSFEVDYSLNYSEPSAPSLEGYKFNRVSTESRTLSNGYTALIADYEIYPVFAFNTDGYVRVYLIYTENVIYRFLVFTGNELGCQDMTDLCNAVENATLNPAAFSGSVALANANQDNVPNENIVDYGSYQNTSSDSSSGVNVTAIVIVAIICVAVVAIVVIKKKK